MTTMLPPLPLSAGEVVTPQAIARAILARSARPLVLVDGVAGSGKTTLARTLAAVMGAGLVHTDDVAWWLDVLAWDQEMIAGVLDPWRAGRTVRYRPSGWVSKNRAGHVFADGQAPLVVEGMSVIRDTLRPLAGFLIWVETDGQIAHQRVIARDLANGENGGTVQSVTDMTNGWNALVIPFMRKQAAWKHADLIVDGTFRSDAGTVRTMERTPAPTSDGT